MGAQDEAGGERGMKRGKHTGGGGRREIKMLEWLEGEKKACTSLIM